MIVYLRTETEAALKAALPMFVADGGAWRSSYFNGPPGIDTRCDLDVIGPIIKPAICDAAGDVVTEAVVDMRWHANLVCSTAFAAQIPTEVVIPAPATPERVSG